MNGYMKLNLILGVAQMFVCCATGFAGDAAIDAAAFRGAHHQYAHNGEFQIALALLQPLAMRGLPAAIEPLLVLLTTAGTWSNPIAYTLVAFSGQRCEIMPSTATHPDGPYGAAAASLLMFVCAPTVLLATLITLVGLALAHTDGAAAAQNKAKRH